MNSAFVRSRWISPALNFARQGPEVLLDRGHGIRDVFAAETWAWRQAMQMAFSGVSARKSLFGAPCLSWAMICSNESNVCSQLDVVLSANMARDLNSLQKRQMR